MMDQRRRCGDSGYSRMEFGSDPMGSRTSGMALYGLHPGGCITLIPYDQTGVKGRCMGGKWRL
jgi:hypothetical protein